MAGQGTRGGAGVVSCVGGRAAALVECAPPTPARAASPCRRSLHMAGDRPQAGEVGKAGDRSRQPTLVSRCTVDLGSGVALMVRLGKELVVGT
jgi:hypothetical protein